MNGAPIALVAGGAGGIGSAISRRLGASGYAVAIADNDAARVDAVCADLGADLSVVADLATEEGATQAVEVARDGGKLAVLVVTLGISPKKDGDKRPYFEIAADEWDRVMAVNLRAPFLLARAAAEHLVAGAGGIVMITSSMAKIGGSGPVGSPFPPWSPSGAHYCASKAALSNLTVSVARELAPRGIRCNGVAPGYIAAKTTGAMGGSAAPNVDSVMRSQVPLGRAGTAAEVADVVAFLVSDAASYVTGEIIDCDGGWIAD